MARLTTIPSIPRLHFQSPIIFFKIISVENLLKVREWPRKLITMHRWWFLMTLFVMKVCYDSWTVGFVINIDSVSIKPQKFNWLGLLDLNYSRFRVSCDIQSVWCLKQNTGSSSSAPSLLALPDSPCNPHLTPLQLVYEHYYNRLSVKYSTSRFSLGQLGLDI